MRCFIENFGGIVDEIASEGRKLLIWLIKKMNKCENCDETKFF